MNHDLLNDTSSLLGQSTQTRRSFLKTSSVAGLGIGFAIASEPVLAQAIKTDFTGIQAGESVIEYGSSKLPIYVARPSQITKNLPVMLVISEIFGVHEHIADVARRFAKLGYLAIAPEFFYRAGDPQQLGTVAEIQAKIVSQTPDAQVLSDLRATINWAIKEGGSTQKIGING
jgi:carboxymethylenebutenolidase